MAYREVSRMVIAEIIRRWQAGSGPQQIASGTGLSRNTVRKYLAEARATGIAKDGPSPDDEPRPRVAGHLGLFGLLPVAAALRGQAQLAHGWQDRRPHGRHPPGQVAESDFGRLSMITDPETGRRRAVWVIGGRNADPRHHLQEDTGGLPGRGAPCCHYSGTLGQ